MKRQSSLKETIEKVTKNLIRHGKSLTASSFQQRAYLVQDLGFPLVLALPAFYHCSNEDGKAEMEYRKSIQQKLGLSTNKGYFREFNSLRSAASREKSTIVGDRTLLRSPHKGPFAKVHSVENGKVYLMDGDFDYYHYGVGYDDKGWGCAYRSLQMVMSWYQLSGQSNATPLSILNIQEKLFDMGVMDAAFDVGCKQWIGRFPTLCLFQILRKDYSGSQEVSWLIDEVNGASSRFIICSRGSEILEKSRELAKHFEENGSPVVVCGGQLALTLLGIAWNENSGECAYLIADPHYSGVDDLAQVQTKSVSLEGNNHCTSSYFCVAHN